MCEATIFIEADGGRQTAVDVRGSADCRLPTLSGKCRCVHAVKMKLMSTNPVVPLTVQEPAEIQPEKAAGLPRPSNAEIASWLLVAAALIFILFEHLVVALISGLALYLVLDLVRRGFARRLSRKTARPLALIFVFVSSAFILSGLVTLGVSVMRHSAGRLPDMMNQMANILDSTRTWLGGYGEQVIPEVLTDADNFKATIADWLKTHAQTVRAAGSYVSLGFVHVLMGALLAILVFFRHVTHPDDRTTGPVGLHLFEKVARFVDVFKRIATAQIKISAVNTTLTAIYLLVLLPAFGKHLPFTTTLIVLTFICGLIPVIGNLISNTVITILSLGTSVGLAVASLVFLILIHKLEYLINSKIVGGETDSQAWEILMAIIIGEAAFGAGGVIMGPIVYAFVKRELREKGLV